MTMTVFLLITVEDDDGAAATAVPYATRAAALRGLRADMENDLAEDDLDIILAGTPDDGLLALYDEIYETRTRIEEQEVRP